MLEIVLSAWWPALLAGVVATLATVAIERWGGLVGGLLATLPTTIVPAALGIWWLSPEPSVFADAMGIVPVGMLLDAAFLWLWRALPPLLPEGSLKLRLTAMTIASLTAWMGAAALVVWGLSLTRDAGVPTLWMGGAAMLVLVMAGLAATRGHRPAPKGDKRVGPLTLLMRGALAASAIAAAVALSEVSGPLTGGIASVFPAIFVTTMVALWLSQGESVPTGAVGPMMLGSTSVAGFALLTAVCVPALGALAGVAVAWVLAVTTCTVPAALWIRRRALVA